MQCNCNAIVTKKIKSEQERYYTRTLFSKESYRKTDSIRLVFYTPPSWANSCGIDSEKDFETIDITNSEFISSRFAYRIHIRTILINNKSIKRNANEFWTHFP